MKKMSDEVGKSLIGYYSKKLSIQNFEYFECHFFLKCAIFFSHSGLYGGFHKPRTTPLLRTVSDSVNSVHLALPQMPQGSAHPSLGTRKQHFNKTFITFAYTDVMFRSGLLLGLAEFEFLWKCLKSFCRLLWWGLELESDFSSGLGLDQTKIVF